MNIVVRQVSGLGNQLFQYAAGRYYANRYGATMRVAIDAARNATSHGHPRPFLLSHFAVTAPLKEMSRWDRLLSTNRAGLRPVSDELRRARGVQIFNEPIGQRYTFLEDLPLEEGVRTLYLGGYWQTYRMADAIAGELRSEFRLREPAQGKNLETLEQIGASEGSVSLHIRRGDYTLAAEGNIALPMRYYTEAIAALRERLDDPLFFVFSDDMEFARANLPRDLRAVFLDHNDAHTSHEDLRLMSACRHHIIANSTFSWWGAWLNPREDKIVFAPRHWLLHPDSYFPDLLPPEWLLGDTARQPTSAAATRASFGFVQADANPLG